MEASVNLQRLRAHLRQYTKQDCVLAFSGGIDSSLLLRVLADCAREQGSAVHAVTFIGSLHPKADLTIARRVAAECGAPLTELTMDELSNEALLNNPVNRCYICKRYLFETLQRWAAERGIQTVLEGTNEDDLHVYRPGVAAVRELGIHSPLAELGFTKQQVRDMARELGISVAERPSSPCMATRLPYGTRLEADVLRRIEDGESFLHALGFAAVRLRLHQDVVRLEVPPADFPRFLAQREAVIERLHALGFVYITLDLEGLRSGSMDLYLNQ